MASFAPINLSGSGPLLSVILLCGNSISRITVLGEQDRIRGHTRVCVIILVLTRDFQLPKDPSTQHEFTKPPSFHTRTRRLRCPYSSRVAVDAAVERGQ